MAIRERFAGEAVPEPCDFGCGGAGAFARAEDPAPCFVERGGVDAEAETLVRTWALCGGRAHSTWPRAGGLADQDAATVLWFEAIDGLVAREEARAARATEAALAKGGR